YFDRLQARAGLRSRLSSTGDLLQERLYSSPPEKRSAFMPSITIPLSGAPLAELRRRAEKAGLAPEEFLRRRVEQLLETILKPPLPDFRLSGLLAARRRKSHGTEATES